MKIEMQVIDDLGVSEIFDELTYVFVGRPNDERAIHAVEIINEKMSDVFVVAYIPETQLLNINGDEYHPYDFFSDDKFRDHKILIEATSLGTSEIILMTKLLRETGCKSISYTYIEPGLYQRHKSVDVIHRRDFELTEMRNSYSSVPGMNYMIDTENHLVAFFAGFEGERMSQVFEEMDINPEGTVVIFGIPAFNPGWEMDSFANHVNLLIEHKVNTRHHYCAANNPLLAYQYLENRYSHKENDKRMFVIPLGTKPQSIGAAIFLSDHDDVGFMYDHPSASDNCSEGISICHYFRFKEEE